MFRILVLVLCCQNVLSQPLNDDQSRVARECCPCPPSDQPGAVLPRTSSDDCPCSARAADAEGSPSLLFPSAMRPDGLAIRSNEPREEGKNLLEPEVNLASSVLDTLREVTEEEYREALEDAARNAADAEPSPEESRNNVVIIVNPRDSDDDDNDFISEATHIKEARCIHPLGSMPIGNMRSSINHFNGLPETLKIPALKRPELPRRNLLHLDSDLGASTVEESMIDPDVNLQSILPKSSLLEPVDNFRSISEKEEVKLRTIQKSTEENNRDMLHDKLPLKLRNILKLRDVELVPKSILKKQLVKPKIDLTRFAIPTRFNLNKNILGHRDSDKEFKEVERFPQYNGLQRDDSNESEMETGASESRFKINEFLENHEPRIGAVFEQDQTVTEKSIDFDSNLQLNDNINNNSCRNPISSEFVNEPTSKETNNDNDEGANFFSNKEVSENDIKESLDKNMDAEKEHDESLFNENVSTNIDSVTESSDNVISIQELLNSKSTEEVDLKNNCDNDTDLNNENGSQSESENRLSTPKENHKEVPSIGDTMTQFREFVFKKLANIDNDSPNKAVQHEMQSKLDNKQSKIDGDRNIITDENKEFDSNQVAHGHADEMNTENNLSMNDLQHMSDKLLNIPHKPIADSVPDLDDSNPSESNLQNIGTQFDESNNEEKSAEIKCFSDNDSKDSKTKAVEKGKSPNNLNNESSQKEMDTGASETFVNTLPSILDPLKPNLKLRSPILGNGIGLPTPSDPLNLLSRPLDDVLKLNTNLPTLDDIRTRLSNIFNTHEEYSEDYSSSLETDATNDSPLQSMATDASTKSTLRDSPMLKQLETFNSNFIRPKPDILSSIDNLAANKLNSFRAHLPSPSNLDLKPLNLESKIGKSSKFTKPLTLETRKIPSLKLKPLENPLDRLGDLEDLRNSINSRAHDLLNSPVRSPLDPITEQIRPHNLEEIAKNARINAEKTLKGLQRKMKTSLKKPDLLNPLGDSLPTPQYLLEDMNDKIKGIHYDLNERLASLRESLFESTKIKGLGDPPRKTSNRNVMTNLRKSKPKSTSRLQSAASAPEAQITELHRNIGNLDGFNPKHRIQATWNSLHETPTSVESDRATSPNKAKETFATRDFAPSNRNVSPKQYLGRTENLREKISVTNPSHLFKASTQDGDEKNSLFKPNFGSWISQRQPKVTVSFGSTTPPAPIVPTRPVIRIPNISKSFKSDDGTLLSAATDDNKVNPAVESKTKIFKYKPLRTSAPLPSSLDEDYEDSLSNFSEEDQPIFEPSNLRQISTVEQKNVRDNKHKADQDFNDKIFDPLSSVKKLKSSRIIENGPGADRKKAGSVRKFNIPKSVKTNNEQIDMLRAPSENKDIIDVDDEPLKENVSYRCRIVCTKEIK